MTTISRKVVIRTSASPALPALLLMSLRHRVMVLPLYLLSLLVVLSLGLAGWTWILGRRAERQFPPLGQFVLVEGSSADPTVRIHYVERGGSGEATIVLIHGAFSSLQDFTATIADDLAKTHCVIAFDRPGHGYSERPGSPWIGTPAAQAEILHKAVTALGVKRPIVVGFSWGGAVALAYALQFPRDTAGLVLLASPSHPWPDPIEREYYIPTWPLIGPLLVRTVIAPIGQMLASRSVEGAFYPLPVSTRFVESPYPLATRPASFEANAEDFRVLKESVRAMSAHYRELKRPVVLVHGTQDHTVGLKIHSEPLHAKVSGSELVTVPGAGHQLLYTHPQLVLEAIERVSSLAAMSKP